MKRLPRAIAQRANAARRGARQKAAMIHSDTLGVTVAVAVPLLHLVASFVPSKHPVRIHAEVKDVIVVDLAVPDSRHCVRLTARTPIPNTAMTQLARGIALPFVPIMVGTPPML